MYRTLFGAIALACLFASNTPLASAQVLLPTKGYGSLSGKVTLEGDVPAVINLGPLMMKNKDAPVCCAPGAQMFDQKWVVDKKTKGVANVAVWVRPPAGKFFDIPMKLKDRTKETVIIDQPNCAFLPYVSAYQPSYFDGKQMVATGQQLIFKNSSKVAHNVRAIGDGQINDGFNKNVPSNTEYNATTDLPDSKKLKAQILPLSIHCDFHTWMAAKVYVFDHPYYAITKADGSYEIPTIPAGAEVILMVYHGDSGWLLPERKKGRPITIKAGEKTTMDFKIAAPK